MLNPRYKVIVSGRGKGIMGSVGNYHSPRFCFWRFYRCLLFKIINKVKASYPWNNNEIML